MSLTDLNSKDGKYKKLSEENDGLLKQQEELLLKVFNESKALIDWYRENEYIFTHPSVKYQSNRGPILGFDYKENDLIVYDPKRGFRKVNVNTRDERTTVASRLIEEGHFETAMDGFIYLETMMDQYLEEIKSRNSKLESQIKKYL